MRHTRRMTRTIALFLSVCLALSGASARAGERPIVVELFTSEGCSSCPPADALLAELANRPDILALSFHVDYWDGLGWTDPYSSHEATQRQRRYKTLLELATVYTPQIVVDGRWEAVGSDRSEVQRALDRAQRSRVDVPVVLAIERGNAEIKLGAVADAASPSVLLIGFDRHHVSKVKGGENGGRILAHADVVRGLEDIGRFSGAAGKIAAPIPWQCDRVAAIVQAKDGRILGVAVGDANPP
jgi:hypothetical protein